MRSFKQFFPAAGIKPQNNLFTSATRARTVAILSLLKERAEFARASVSIGNFGLALQPAGFSIPLVVRQWDPPGTGNYPGSNPLPPRDSTQKWYSDHAGDAFYEQKQRDRQKRFDEQKKQDKQNDSGGSQGGDKKQPKGSGGSGGGGNGRGSGKGGWGGCFGVIGLAILTSLLIGTCVNRCSSPKIASVPVQIEQNPKKEGFFHALKIDFPNLYNQSEFRIENSPVVIMYRQSKVLESLYGTNKSDFIWFSNKEKAQNFISWIKINGLAHGFDATLGKTATDGNVQVIITSNAEDGGDISLAMPKPGQGQATQPSRTSSEKQAPVKKQKEPVPTQAKHSPPQERPFQVQESNPSERTTSDSQPRKLPKKEQILQKIRKEFPELKSWKGYTQENLKENFAFGFSTIKEAEKFYNMLSSYASEIGYYVFYEMKTDEYSCVVISSKPKE